MLSTATTAITALAGAGSLVDDDTGAAPTHRVSSALRAHRAKKSADLLEQVARRISEGDAVALLPAMSSDDYVHEVQGELEAFASAAGEGFSAREAGSGHIVLPTSGSTGRPKLVALPAQGVERFLQWGSRYFSFDETTVSLSLSPWNFDVSFLDTWAVLAAGGRVVAADPQRLHQSSYLLDRLSKEELTFLQLVPATVQNILEAVPAGLQFRVVQDVVLTGGVASRSSRLDLVNIFPDARFHYIYGATEFNDCLILSLSGEDFASAPALPLGTPIEGCEVFVEINGQLVEASRVEEDTKGELLVRTPWMARGYIADGHLHPLPTRSTGYYPTKDIVTVAQGQIQYLGRTDRTVKIRGQRINLDEIEQAACASGYASSACAWISSSAETEALHLAYTRPTTIVETSSSLQLRLALSRDLPPHAVPNAMHYLPRFPVNGNGKTDRARVRAETERGK